MIAAESRFQIGLDELIAAERAIDEFAENDNYDRLAMLHLRDKREELLDFFFPQHDNHCLRYGSPCSFSEVCFNDMVGDDPLGSGLYQIRTPHHSTETEG